MSKPENGRRKRHAGTERPRTRASTIRLPLELKLRLEAYKNGKVEEYWRNGDNDRGLPMPTEIAILTAALDDYLKKKGA